MGAAKRTMQEREAQLPEIERLHNAGFSLREIGARFDVSARVVRRDLATIAERYLDADFSDRVAGVNRTIAAIRIARREAWEAWQRSKEDQVRHVEEKVGGTIRTRTITESRLPKHEHLLTILRTLQEEAMLRGLYAPMQNVSTYPQLPRGRRVQHGAESLANQPAEVEPSEQAKPQAEPGVA
jgi:hypothetical protein